MSEDGYTPRLPQPQSPPHLHRPIGIVVNDNCNKKHHYNNNNTFGKTKDPSKPATLANPRNAPAEKIMIEEKHKYTGKSHPNNHKMEITVATLVPLPNTKQILS